MQIFVKTLIGPPIALKVEDTDTIEAVKAKLKVGQGIPPGKQYLFYKEKELEDDQTLQDCDVAENSTLHLVVSLRGAQGDTSGYDLDEAIADIEDDIFGD